MIPIAYGKINDNGTILQGSGNFTTARTGSHYTIYIAGTTLDDAAQFSMVATRLGTPGFIVTGYGHSSTTGLGLMLVKTYNIDGNDAESPFSFVIYQD